MRWSDLARDDPVRLELELAKNGTTAHNLIKDALDVPALRKRMKLLSTREARLRLALEWFGDEGHHQPEQRTRWQMVVTKGGSAGGTLTPHWGQLPPLEDDKPLGAQRPRQPKPRYRPPRKVAKSTVKSLQWELGQRRAKPGDREYTQERIAERVGVPIWRVQRAEALQRAGWDLLRTDPDFPVDEGFVRWPGPDKAARLLAASPAQK